MSGDAARLSIRIDLPDGRRFGPGMAALLAAIAEAGSIAGAARSLQMSYARAWRLVDAMNGLFSAPLVETRQGGSARGGAALTVAGERALVLYREVAATAEKRAAGSLRALRDL
ncbi:MAG: LysR family transcriptional regulator [Pseudomonadota bacterium]